MAGRFRARRLRKLTQQFGVDLPAPNRTEALARRQLARDYSQGRPALSSGIEGGRTSSRVALGDGMRAVRLVIAVLIVSPILMLALSESRLARQPFAQITAAPGPVPLTAPVAPGQPRAFSTIGALPALAPAPGTSPAAIASAAQTPRAFRCTCTAPGSPTQWAGVVSSSSYVLASQSARGQCANYLLNENAPSPYIPPQGTTLSQQRPTIYNGTAFTQRAQVSTSVGQSFLLPRSKVALEANECTRCACN